jgi:hypothetical protein
MRYPCVAGFIPAHTPSGPGRNTVFLMHTGSWDQFGCGIPGLHLIKKAVMKSLHNCFFLLAIGFKT